MIKSRLADIADVIIHGKVVIQRDTKDLEMSKYLKTQEFQKGNSKASTQLLSYLGELQ